MTVIQPAIDQLKTALAAHSRWTVVGHAIPDGDCVGSLIATAHALRAMGKEVTMVIEDGVPELYSFLRGADEVGTLSNLPAIYPCLFYVDCADPDRAGDKMKQMLNHAEMIVNVDHHISNTRFGQVNIVEASSSSTCELLTGIFQSLGLAIPSEIATPLYCGLVTDTGSFQYAQTYPETHRTAAMLLESMEDPNYVRMRIHESKTRTEVAVLQAALSSLTYSEDGQVAWMQLEYKTLERIGALNQHYEGIINMARAVEGVEVALLFRELSPGTVKIGFRSKGKVDVNALAGVYGGGGHPRAAGAQLKGALPDIQQEVINKVKELLA